MARKTRREKHAYVDGYGDALRAVLEIISKEYPGIFGEFTFDLCDKIAHQMKKAKP